MKESSMDLMVNVSAPATLRSANGEYQDKHLELLRRDFKLSPQQQE